jgi:transcriptional regulator with XRE-family HTH domain
MRDTLRSPRQIVLRTELRKLRERQGLSQVTVAKRLNKHQSFVSKYESGERRLSVIEFIDVVRALGGEPAAALRRPLDHWLRRLAAITGSVHGHHRQSATLRSWCAQPSSHSSRFEDRFTFKAPVRELRHINIGAHV